VTPLSAAERKAQQRARDREERERYRDADIGAGIVSAQMLGTGENGQRLFPDRKEDPAARQARARAYADQMR
jgi:hypothetical protein